MTRRGVPLWAAWLGVLALALPLRSAETVTFKEVYELVRTNALGVGDAELNRAAVEGLLAKMNNRAWIVDSTKAMTPETNAQPVSSSAIFDESYGYIRVGRISAPLPEQFTDSLAKLTATNKLKGLVVDLRYAGGTDYAAAAKVADRFLGSEQPLLDWGQGKASATDKTNAFRQPVAVLVNQFTTGAAEALAGVLRSKEIALLIGTNTAGQASITKDFPLSDGKLLRIAVAPVKSGEAVINRLNPDIQVPVSAEDERAYFVDAYKVLPRTNATGLTNIASLSITNRSRRRINEAELVRMLRDGENPEQEVAKAPAEPPKPVIADPALARAIDLLKALAVVRHTRA